VLPFYLARDDKAIRYYKGKVIKRIYNRYIFHQNYLKYAFATVSNEHEYIKYIGDVAFSHQAVSMLSKTSLDSEQCIRPECKSYY